MSALDIICAIILIAATVRCTARGFIRETLSTGALIAALWGAILFSRGLTELLERFLAASRWNVAISFLALFALIYLVFKMAENLVQRAVERINLVNLDRALGFVLGVVEGVAIIVVMLFVLSVQPFFSPEELLAESFVAGVLSPLLPYAVNFIQERLLERAP